MPEKSLSFRVLLAMGTGLLLGCAETSEPPEPRPSFVLVVVDTLRADRLGFAGYDAGTTPGFDALRGKSIWFRNAWSTSSWTLPATASLFVSQLVSEHGVARWGSRLPASATSVLEPLRKAGYRTGMWSANRMVAGARGFSDRFDHYDFVTHPDYRGGAPLGAAAFGTASQVAEHALAWLETSAAASPRRPFLAYLHFMEPHGPYLCAEEAGPDCARAAMKINRRLLEFDWELGDEERALLQELYDADVARMDAALSGLVQALETGGLLDDAWLVLVADHGELLGEWGMYMHGRTLHRALVEVPMLFRPPGGGEGVVDEPVSLIDVAPTILDLAGVEAPASFRGRSLRPALEGRALAPRPVVAELFEKHARPDARLKHVVAVSDGRTKHLMRADGVLERFDLDDDPEEQRAISASRDEFLDLLEQAGVEFDLDSYLSGEGPEPTPEMFDALRNLGYVR